MVSSQENERRTEALGSNWAQCEASSVREAARSGKLNGPTSGLAEGFVQANLAILPASDADDFLRFCQLNSRPCPLLAVSEPGAFAIPDLAENLDVRTDATRYKVFHNGQVTDEPYDIKAVWRDDLVTFALGCSFTFEHELLASGVSLRHIETGTNLPVFNTNVPLRSAGKFSGNLVVSMRPLNAKDAIRAIQISSRFPLAHGAPVHFGHPELIGINDINTPDYGEPLEIKPDEFPVFWACGVTPQVALAEAKLPFAITHYPGHMLVTDISRHSLSIL